jgi:hypothetical protein
VGFLNPIFLLAAAALAVPLLLHLIHRHQTRRVVFPALRYLLRTEREHARRIRLRQILLLLVRCLAVVALVLAGARPFLRGSGEAHPPTALVLILDNSLSAGRVVDEDRVLDHLKALALASLELATPADRIWVLRAGEPWDVAVPGGPGEARRRVEETRLSGARGDLTAALTRARGLVAGANLEAREIHLLSDLQASAFAQEAAGGEPVPTLVYTGLPPAAANRYLRAVGAGGGLPPLADRRFDAVVELGGAPDDTARVAVRMVLNGEVRGATVLRAGGSAVLPVGPFGAGVVTGWAESDPDELAADDRRYVAFRIQPPPTVAVAGDPGLFVDEALEVLVAADRLRRPGVDPADMLISVAGAGLDAPTPRRVVLPPADDALLPALNRRLAEAGVAWRYDVAPAIGELRPIEVQVPVDLAEVRVSRRFLLAGPPFEPDAPGEEGARVLVRLSDGSPLLVSVPGARGEHLLLATPLDASASTLPVDAAMVPLLEWMASGWPGRSGTAPALAGEPLALPSAATEVELPDGTRTPVDGRRELLATRDPGIYTVFRGDSVLEQVAVNASIRESLLAPLSRASLRERLGDDVVTVDAPGTWQRETFIDRQGRELWRILLLAALLLLLLESRMAASGGKVAAGVRGPSPTPAPDRGSALQP